MLSSGLELTGGRLRVLPGAAGLRAKEELRDGAEPARWTARVPGSEAAPGRPAAPAAHCRTAGLDADLCRPLGLRRRQSAEYAAIERRDVPPTGAGPQDRLCHLVLRAGIGLETFWTRWLTCAWRRPRPCRPATAPAAAAGRPAAGDLPGPVGCAPGAGAGIQRRWGFERRRRYQAVPITPPPTRAAPMPMVTGP
ncbi:hypothetical protein ABZ922_18875 [Streptomyces shenzhenensis]|uniref:hypothetical protein n=1 Tax=Streptomyces shenzhenensis TaxID=943815 RepID=UPI0033F65DF0